MRQASFCHGWSATMAGGGGKSGGMINTAFKAGKYDILMRNR
jgi:hypothetical protein